MFNSSAIRGSRIGFKTLSDPESVEAEPRIYVSYYCANGHVNKPAFATDAEVPPTWDCPKCGLPGSQDQTNPPDAPKNLPYKTHLAYVKERRSAADADQILATAIGKLRQRRENGEIFY